ncbi:hypothetical protein [Methylobacterium tarhaniae]|uniref:hypothetical protein n=1 Tax=Methylobacterium tarhaniae TaxID=1187852 RepID=UPI003D06040B
MIANRHSLNRDVEPFGETTAIPFEATYSLQEFARIRRGLVPSAMEDKWFIYLEQNELSAHRSWTGKAVFKLAFVQDTDVVRVVAAECASDVCAARGAAYEAELLGFLIDNLLLGRSTPFPIPADVKDGPEGAYQHHVAGTGYPERTEEV